MVQRQIGIKEKKLIQEVEHVGIRPFIEVMQGAFPNHVKRSQDCIKIVGRHFEWIQVKYCMASFEYSMYFSELKEDTKRDMRRK